MSELREKYQKKQKVIKIKEPNMEILKDEQYIKKISRELSKYNQDSQKSQQVSDKTLLSRFNF